MRKFCYAGFGGLLLLIGCNVSDLDFSNLKIKDGEADVAVPFGFASYTMRELIESSSPGIVLNEDPETGEMWVSYTSGPTTFNYDGSFIDATAPVDNTTNSSLPTRASSISSQDVPFAFVYTQPYFSNTGERLDEIYYNGGTIDLDISTDLNSTVGVISSYTVLVNELRDRTSNTQMSFTGSNISSGIPGVHAPVSLANQKITFVQSGGASSYQITVTGTITLNANQALTGAEQLTVRFQFAGQGNEIIVGRFGQDVCDLGTQTMAVDFFQNFGVTGIEFGGSELTFDCTNTFGIPIAIDMSGIYGQDMNGVQTFMTGSVINNPRIIQSSPTSSPITGQAVQTIITANDRSSNLTDILAASPVSFTYALQGLTNNGSTTTTNFVMANSSVTTSLELYIPMEVRMTDVQHSVDFNIAGQGQLSEVDTAALRVVTTNEFPFAGTFDMYILSAADDTLYTAAENIAFDIPFLTQDLTAREPKISADDVPLSKAGLEALMAGDRVRITFTMNTPVSTTAEGLFVKILSSAKMDVQLGARFLIKSDL